MSPTGPEEGNGGLAPLQAALWGPPLPVDAPAVRAGAGPVAAPPARPDLSQLRRAALACTRCPLAAGRTQVVWGEGPEDARLMLVGEGPGATEDATGRPFVGAAGQLLDRILDAAGFARQEVYITNTVLCRPPGNRAPTDAEVEACRPYLQARLEVIRPDLVVLLGASAARAVLGPQTRISRDRGRVVDRNGQRFLATFHPAALLRDPSRKRAVWEDFQVARDLVRGRSAPDLRPRP
jgi:uracil-DNA glycosylase family 4